MQNETTIQRQSYFDPSRFLGSVLLGVVGGAVAGLIAGVLARGAMRGVALGIGQTPGFTAGGTFVILGIGAVAGAIIGILFSFSLPLWPGSARRKGALLARFSPRSSRSRSCLLPRRANWPCWPPWATAALFAPIPLIYGVVLGMMIDRLASGSGETAAQDAGVLRTLGTLTVFAALIGAAFEIFQAAAFPAANVIGAVASLRVGSAAGIATVLTLIAGVIGLSRSKAAGDHQLVNAGLGITLLTFSLVGLVELFGGLGAMEMHGLVRLMIRMEYDQTLLLLFIPLALSSISLLAAGIAALRTRRWTGWHVYTPLAVGVVPVLSILLLHPAFLPSLANISVYGRNQLGQWVGAVYSLAWLAFGLALRAESER